MVVSDEGHPLAVVPGVELLASILPGAVREDALLAAVVGEALDAEARARAVTLRIADVLPPGRPTFALAGPDASPMRMAALMARTGCALVLVVEYDGDEPHLLGTVDATTLLHHYL